jgi:CubicO group peptidase (beta-lactamase class C family)
MADTETRLPLMSNAVVQQLDTLFAPWNRTDAPGLVVGVSMAGKPLYRRGFGMASLEFGIAASPTTRMRIGSTSKHFTCLLALLLAEDSKLSIDAPIRTYIPELVGPGGEPTLRELMQHRGGSRCYLDIGFLSHGSTTPSKGYALATQVRQTGRNFPPGEAALYNNGGYHLVSLAIERAERRLNSN